MLKGFWMKRIQDFHMISLRNLALIANTLMYFQSIQENFKKKINIYRII